MVSEEIFFLSIVFHFFFCIMVSMTTNTNKQWAKNTYILKEIS